MDTRKTIRKILFVAMWLVICAGMLTLFIAAMSKQKRELCGGYSIKIKAERKTDFFLDEQAIFNLLKAAAKGNIRGQSRAALNLQQMEELLEDNVWIKDAQLYFDNKAILHISVQEREPLARLFTTGGRSFYIDEGETALPLSEKTVAKVPVFTGYPDKKLLSKEDSMLLHEVSNIAKYISAHPFWSSQVAQVDIVAGCGPGCREFEMIPVIGMHVVKFGNGENIEQKFQRLLAFYQQVLGQTGMDHYKTVDVRFTGQVIGAKSENPRIDSVQLRKSVEDLLRQMEELTKEDPVIENSQAFKTEVSNNPKPGERLQDNPNPPSARINQPGNEEQRVPRAVMPSREN